MRATAGLVAVALLVLATPASATPPRGIDRVCPPPADTAVTAPDLPDRGSTHGEAIVCAARYGLVGGFADGTYRPGVPVTRGQTASVLSSWLERATGFPLELPDESPFSDQGTHAAAIARLADVGIVTGREDGTFGASEPLTRGQFARIMVRAISYADVFAIDGPLPPVPEPDEAVFTDVAGSTFAEDIQALGGTGIATGVEPDRYAPGELVTRGQLASFLMRAADYLDRHQRWAPTALVVTFLTDLELVTASSGAGQGGEEVGTAVPSTSEDAEGRVWLTELSATVVINAFNGTIGYLVELSGLDGALPSNARLTLRLGAVEDPGPVVVTLAEAGELETARRDTGIATGTSVEADSSVRFADLLLTDATVVLELQDAAAGSYRGVLQRVR